MFLTIRWALSFPTLVQALSLPKKEIWRVRQAPVNSPIVLVLAKFTKRALTSLPMVFLRNRRVKARVVLMRCLLRTLAFMTTWSGQRPLHSVPDLCRNLGSKTTPSY